MLHWRCAEEGDETLVIQAFNLNERVVVGMSTEAEACEVSIRPGT